MKKVAVLVSIGGLWMLKNRYKYYKTIQSSLQDKYVLITGCDTGIGRSAIQRMYEAGFHVFAACLTPEAVSDIKKEYSDQVIPFIMDVSNEESVRDACHFVKSTIPNKTCELIFLILLLLVKFHFL